MPTPKLPADLIEKLRKFAEQYEQEHVEGNYAAKTTHDRGAHAHRFIDFLEGRYDPKADYGKRVVP